MLSLLPCPEPDCDAPAEVLDRTTLSSTCGPIEHVKTQCARRHVFLMPTPAAYLSTDTLCQRSDAATAQTGHREAAGMAREQCRGHCAELRQCSPR
jgi:hypothetical protein